MNSDAAGGSALRAIDHVRFLAAFDIREDATPHGAPKAHPFLKKDALHALFDPPEFPFLNYPSGRRRGWDARVVDDPGAQPGFKHYTAYLHAGGLDGTKAYAVRTTAGVSFVVSFATDLAPGRDPISGKMVGVPGATKSAWEPRCREIMDRLARIPAWPHGDHFPEFGMPSWATKKKKSHA